MALCCLFKRMLCVFDFLFGAMLPTDLQRRIGENLSKYLKCVSHLLLEWCWFSACSGIWQIDLNGFCLLLSVLCSYSTCGEIQAQWTSLIGGAAALLQSDFTRRSCLKAGSLSTQTHDRSVKEKGVSVEQDARMCCLWIIFGFSKCPIEPVSSWTLSNSRSLLTPN